MSFSVLTLLMEDSFVKTNLDKTDNGHYSILLDFIRGYIMLKIIVCLKILWPATVTDRD
jgi:hypothetical protein